MLNRDIMRNFKQLVRKVPFLFKNRTVLIIIVRLCYALNQHNNEGIPILVRALKLSNSEPGHDYVGDHLGIQGIVYVYGVAIRIHVQALETKHMTKS